MPKATAILLYRVDIFATYKGSTIATPAVLVKLMDTRPPRTIWLTKIDGVVYHVTNHGGEVHAISSGKSYCEYLENLGWTVESQLPEDINTATKTIHLTALRRRGPVTQGGI
jgi:hypothetical protein